MRRATPKKCRDLPLDRIGYEPDPSNIFDQYSREGCYAACEKAGLWQRQAGECALG